jgi:hypothetical protein
MPTRQFFGPGSYFLEFLLNSRGWRKERSRESIRIPFFLRIDTFTFFENFCTSAGTYKVRRLMISGLGTAFSRMTCVYEHAGAQGLIKGEEPRYTSVEPADVNANAELKL